MNNLLLIRGARQLLTLRGPREARRGTQLGELNIVSDGAILVRDGIIVDIGVGRLVENSPAARHATEINATGRVVMPAFVDGMARAAFAHTPLHSEAVLTPECARALHAIPFPRLEARSRSLLHDMLRHGTATVEAQSGAGLDESGELKSLRVYRALDSSPVEIISTYAPLAPIAESLLETIAHRKLARFVDVRCAPDSFSHQEARKILAAAARAGLGLKLQALGPAPDQVLALAVEMGVTSIGHLNDISPADIALIAESPVIAALTPGTAYHARQERFAPARALIDSGAAVALASGFNAANSPFYSIPFIISLACRHMSMTAAEAITASTINGAYAAGCGSRTGSLELGKQADLIICNVHDYREIPHFAGSNPVRTVIKKGSVVYHAGKVGAP